MIEINIPRDIREYDSKLVGPFTTRQTVCLVVGGIAAFVTYKLLGNTAFIGSDVRLFVSGLIALPALLLGWLKPYGMKLEDFLKSVLVSNFFSPKKRLYKTENDCFEKRKPMTEKEKKQWRKNISHSAYK